MKAGLTRVMDGDEKSKEREEDEEEGYRKKRICSAPEEGKNRGNRSKETYIWQSEPGADVPSMKRLQEGKEKKSKIEECVT